MKYNTESIKIYGVILILILGIVAVSTNYWSINNINKNNNPDNINNNTINSNFGLWKFCQTQGNDKKICINTANLSSNNLQNLNTVKILSISSLFLIALSLYLLYYMPKQKEYFVLCLVLAGILSVISVIIWNNDKAFKNYIGDVKHGYSWYLQLFNGLIAILLGSLTQLNIIA